MRLFWFSGLLIAFCSSSLCAQTPSDPVKLAISQGDVFQSKRKYELAQEAYRKADKASHHTSAEAYLKLAAVDKKLGDFSSSLDDAKKALKVAGDNKTWAMEAHSIHASLLVQMSSKPGDKKLKEAEAEIRQAMALDPSKAIVHFNLGYVLLKQERDPEGIAELTAYVQAPGATEANITEARRMIANPIRAREPFAPDFSFTSHEKEAISNSSLHGKVVLMDFWGTWCPPCRESVPVLRNLQKKYASKGFQLVGVSSDDDEDVWRTFIESQKMGWTEYIDLQGEVLEAFKIESFPTYIVLDKDGVMRFRQSGFGDTTAGELEDAINKALKRPSDPSLAAISPTGGTAGETTRVEAQPAANAVTSASGSAEHDAGIPRDSDTTSASTLFGIEAGAVSGNVYKDDALSLAYEFPKGWIAAKPEALHSLNEKMESAAKANVLQQHPEVAGSLRIMTPKIIFYASRRGDGDGQRLSFPCVRITAIPSRVSSLSLDTFRQTADTMASGSGAKVSTPAAEFTVKNHPFLRADFERSMAGQKVFQSYVQTLSEDYLLTIEIYSLSKDDQQVAVDSLQKIVVDD
jgi:thiol-disulfide isomerase/thioredoxin